MANESDPLLSGSGDGRSDAQADKAARNSRLRELGLFAWALIATAAVIVVAIWTQHEQQTKHDHNTPASKRNLVFMVSDGMGPAPLSLTRSFRQHVEELPFGDTLTLDKHFWGHEPDSLQQFPGYRQCCRCYSLLLWQEDLQWCYLYTP
ncbi:vacuolar alkaline phosphatase [Fusarium oxysporum]|nr:vacuolar alkaline phosphatase [Fusarium oxysporum]